MGNLGGIGNGYILNWSIWQKAINGALGWKVARFGEPSNKDYFKRGWGEFPKG